VTSRSLPPKGTDPWEVSPSCQTIIQHTFDDQTSLFKNAQRTLEHGQLGCSLLLNVMRQVTSVWCLYLLVLSVFRAPVFAGPCAPRGTLSWAIAQNCSLDTAELSVPITSDVAVVHLEGAAGGELPTVLLSGPPLTGVLTHHHHSYPASLSRHVLHT
jgi:hypothetical protein